MRQEEEDINDFIQIFYVDIQNINSVFNWKDLKGFGQIQSFISKFTKNLLDFSNQLDKSIAQAKNNGEKFFKIIGEDQIIQDISIFKLIGIFINQGQFIRDQRVGQYFINYRDQEEELNRNIIIIIDHIFNYYNQALYLDKTEQQTRGYGLNDEKHYQLAIKSCEKIFERTAHHHALYRKCNYLYLKHGLLYI
ncbi:unnamed protein product [Paramecium sonneborni]|uniref:Uncharacterized protein n=1 Tax=Paramecium sonneborni TaxID=65129 RepID=A0A8S1PD02_9CILI|nr:unnamed protein product [Paramecium sonneborni]